MALAKRDAESGTNEFRHGLIIPKDADVLFPTTTTYIFIATGRGKGSLMRNSGASQNPVLTG
jgi:hypothetical protein